MSICYLWQIRIYSPKDCRSHQEANRFATTLEQWLGFTFNILSPIHTCLHLTIDLLCLMFTKHETLLSKCFIFVVIGITGLLNLFQETEVLFTFARELINVILLPVETRCLQIALSDFLFHWKLIAGYSCFGNLFTRVGSHCLHTV